MATSVNLHDMKHVIAQKRLVGLLRMMKGLSGLYISAIVTRAIAAVAMTASFLLIGYFVDEILYWDNLNSALPVIAFTLIALAVVQGLFTYLSGRWASETAEQVAWRLRNYLYDHLQRMRFSYHDQNQTGELLQRSTSDVETIRRFYAEQGIGLGRILLLFSVNFIGIIIIDWRLALISILIAPVLIGLSIFFFKKIEKAYDEFQTMEGKLSTTLQENLSGVRVVKAFARQQHESEKFEHDNWNRYSKGYHLIKMEAYYWPTVDLLTGLQLAGGFFVGALFAINGDISLGSFLAYMGMVGAIINPMRMLGRLIVQATTGLVSYERVAELIREEQEFLGEDYAAPVNELRGDIVFDHVSFEYEPGNPVLEDISFHCKAGHTIAILGSTGSGKTSLVNLLPRFYDYTSGSIRLDGIELTEFPRRFLRDNIGIVEQEPFLFSRSIRENITFSVGRNVSDEEVERAARAAAIHDVIMGFPEGYQTMVGERGVTLSGGQKQRVTLARTLLKNSRILILDDATSSVDTETESHIRNALNTMMKNRTSIIIAHRIHSVMHADLILVMDHGKVVQMGTHDELMLESGIYRRTYDMQSRIETELEKELTSA